MTPPAPATRAVGSRRRPRWPLAATCTIAVLAGCAHPAGTGTATTPSAHPSPTPTLTAAPAAPTVRDAARLTLPIDRYLWSASETTTLHQAQDAIIATCLRQFDMTLPMPPATDDLAPESPTARRYGITSMSEARTYGYRLPAALSARDPQPSPAAGDDRVLGVITGAVTTVAGKAVPPGGCAGQADREIGHGAPVGVADQAQDVNSRAWELARDDPRVQSGFAAWAACMRAAGYTYADPIAPMNDSRFSGVPTGHEKAVAAADVACKDTTNVTGIWYAYDVAYQEALIKARAADFAEILAEKSAQLAASRAVLDQG